MELKDVILQALDEVEHSAQNDRIQKDGTPFKNTQNVPNNSDNSDLAELEKQDSATNKLQVNENEISLNERLNENLNALKDNLNANVEDSNNLDELPNPTKSLQSALNRQSLTKDSALKNPLMKSTLKIESSRTTSGKVIPPNEVVLSPTNIEFLEMLREKLLVLFEGLKMPQMSDSKEKLDLVVNFLQYELCLLDDFLRDNKK